MRRVYCGRIGATLELEEGVECEECGYKNHHEYTKGDCGCYAFRKDLTAGTHCPLPIGHSGRHVVEAEEIVKEVLES